MVALDITETSKALAVTGGYISVFGLCSYFVKEKLFICEFTLISRSERGECGAIEGRRGEENCVGRMPS